MMTAYMMSNDIRWVVGTMTGTSIDGIDCALIKCCGHGFNMTVQHVKGHSKAFPASLQQLLRQLAEQVPMTAKDITTINRDFAVLHVAAIQELIDDLHRDGHHAIDIDLLAIHGQTVFHAPPFLSWQLLNPAPLVQEFQVPVVFDMRSADLSCGGNGAPITPLADWIIFRDHESKPSDPLSMNPCNEGRAIINLGGFCNITLLVSGQDPSSSVTGGDVCACNQLLDTIARLRLNATFDIGGRAALHGNASVEIVEYFEQRLHLQAGSRLSLGTADEPSQWISPFMNVPAEVVARSACCAIANVIAAYVRKSSRDIKRLIVAGGGVNNRALLSELQLHFDRVVTTEEFGIPPSYREAIEMAVLGALCQDGVPITLPAITGVPDPAPIAGLWALPTKAKSKYRPGGDQLLQNKMLSTGTSVNFDTQLPSSVVEASIRKLPIDRSHVSTELRNPHTMNLHELSIENCVKCFQEEDVQVVAAAKGASNALVAMLVQAEPGFLAGGRIVYLGAGTSGRLGVLDASEAPPTFQVDPNRVVGIIAGGDKSLRKSSEGAEDDPAGALEDLHALNLTSKDLVVGIAAGGTTPYVIGALSYLGDLPIELRPVTGLITCATISEPPSAGTHIIYLATGPEVITGSTRLKAGTCTKLILNVISSTLMIRSGKVFENLMVDLKATNSKLRDRAARIISTLTGIPREASFQLLDDAGGSCKIAVIMQKRNVSREIAEEMLRSTGGSLADL